MENVRKYYGDAVVIFDEYESGMIDRDFRLEYYRLQASENDDLRYGIEIVKKHRDDDVVLEKKCIENISNSEQDINDILRMFQKNIVTPVSAGDVIEDLMKDKLFSNYFMIS